MANPNSDTWSNLLYSDATARAKDNEGPSAAPAKENEGPSTWDKVASGLGRAGNFAAGFAAEQMHAAGQDFVSRVLLNETYSHDPNKDHAKDEEKDKAKEQQGMDR